MHSGLLILLWMAGLAFLQLLSLAALLSAVAGCTLAALALAPRRGWRLLKRVRFLLLAIVVLFGGFTPGEALFVNWPIVSPSREGAVLALEHAARIVAVVMCVAVLMERLPVHRMVSAIHALLRPFEAFGFPASRVAVRLLLVLRLVESGAPKGWQSWLHDVEDEPGEAIEVVRERLGMRDVGAVAAFAVVIAVLSGLAR
jgi:energy-coupling factor transporter transmembrane protein EcfT